MGLIGAAAGSLFVFKGKYRAVLINYPNRMEKTAAAHVSLNWKSISILAAGCNISAASDI
jgi:hypothetical protein